MKKLIGLGVIFILGSASLASAKICIGADSQNNQFQITVNANQTSAMLKRVITKRGSVVQTTQKMNCTASTQTHGLLECSGLDALLDHGTLRLDIYSRDALIIYDVDETLKDKMVMVAKSVELKCRK